jgi:hypothetical protein
MEGKFHLHLVGVGQKAAAQLPSGKNNTFYHPRETGSWLKLTDFQEKSDRLKSSVLAPRLALQ